MHFTGPLTFGGGDRCLYESAFADDACVYLWTIRRESDGAHLIHYIGETDALAKRHREHLIDMLGLNYGSFDLQSARQGELVQVWPGLWRDKSPTAPATALARYASMAQAKAEYIEAISVFVAPLDVDRGMRRHIEGSIAKSLRAKQSPDGALYPSDVRTGVSRSISGVRLHITSDELIAGLDSVLDI